MNKISPKVALITGASHGIGQAIAERLSQDGLTVIINYAHSQMEAEALASKLINRGGNAVCLQADMGNPPSDIRAMFVKIDRLFDRLNILINNAAVTKGAPLSEITEALISDVFAVNIKGVITASQEAANDLDRAGGSSIFLRALPSFLW